MSQYVFRHERKEPVMTKLKREIERLKYHVPQENYVSAVVSFNFVDSVDDRKWYFGVRYDPMPELHYSVSRNFDGGCSMSRELVGKFDLDSLFDYLREINDRGTISNIKFYAPRFIYEYWML